MSSESNIIMCLEMFNGEPRRREWCLVKVPVPSDSERKIIEELREVEKKQDGEILKLYGTKLVFYHSHNEKPGVLYPRVSFGHAFASASGDDFDSVGLAVLGNFLYFVGGSVNVSDLGFQLRTRSKKGRLSCFTTDVQCCELSISGLFIRSVSYISGMKSPRSEPSMLVLDAKLYVLGGLDEDADEKGPWIEAFDPVLQRWNDIPDPPVKNLIESLYHFKEYACAALEHSKEIFLATNDEICFFSPEKNAWNRIIRHEMDIKVWGQGMIVGQTLYWFNPENIMFSAYDLQTDEWRHDHIEALGFAVADCNVQMARANGNSLYLLWTSDSRLHCFRFKVSSALKFISCVDVECCVFGEIDKTTTLISCWFVGEESSIAGTSR